MTNRVIEGVSSNVVGSDGVAPHVGSRTLTNSHRARLLGVYAKTTVCVFVWLRGLRHEVLYAQVDGPTARWIYQGYAPRLISSYINPLYGQKIQRP